MTISIIGQIATNAGLAQQFDAWGQPDPFRLPANSYLPNQPRRLPVCMGHGGWEVGEVASLVRSPSVGLLAIGRLDADLGDLLDEGGWYMSGDVALERTGPLQYGYARLREVALVRNPAAVNIGPIRWRESDIALDGGKPPHLGLTWGEAWDRAHQELSRYRSRPSAWLEILDLGPKVHPPIAPVSRPITRRRPAPAVPPQRIEGQVRIDGEWADEETTQRILRAMQSPTAEPPQALQNRHEHEQDGGWIDGHPMSSAVARKVRQMLDENEPLESVARFARSFVA